MSDCGRVTPSAFAVFRSMTSSNSTADYAHVAVPLWVRTFLRLPLRRVKPEFGYTPAVKTDLLLIPMGAHWTDMRAAAVAADEAGFDGVWTWDHLRDPEGDPAGVPECLTTLAALAEATKRVSLGSLVLNVSNRHPGLLANMAATLQQISGGRFIVGLGAGGGRRTPYAREQEGLGLSVEADPVRAERVAEAAQ